uniref:Uncharacterized protein n=1 Tax=Anguilla anguilla TaxID=7936 RepID=A0A0E9W5N5_ANGAN
MQLLQDGEKLGWYPKFGELFPEHLTVYGVKGFAEVNEGYVQVFALLSALL